MKINPRAGQPANASDLVDVPKLITAYYEDRPDPHIPEQRVSLARRATGVHLSIDHSMNGTFWPSRKRFAYTGSSTKSMDHFSWESTRTRFHGRLWRVRLKSWPRTAST